MIGEIESDLSVFHRIDDMWSMEAVKFWRLAPQLPAYAGAVASAVHAKQKEGRTMTTTAAQPSARPSQPGLPMPPGARVIGATAAEIGLSDIGDLFSVGSARG